MGRFLGQVVVTGTLTYNPSTKIVSWSTNAPSGDVVEVFVNGTLFAGAASGSQPAPWVSLGNTYLFELLYNGAVLATVNIAPDGTVTGETIYGGEVPPVEIPASTEPVGGNGMLSWFEGSTVLFGAEVPNIALAGGAGLLLLVAMRKRKG